jgi:hypothetical protein
MKTSFQDFQAMSYFLTQIEQTVSHMAYCTHSGIFPNMFTYPTACIQVLCKILSF